MGTESHEDTVPVPDLDLSPPQEQVPAADHPAPETDAPKRRRRRRKQEPEAAVAAVEPTTSPEEIARCEVALALGFKMLADAIAARRGGHWALDDEEVTTLGKVWTQVLV